MQNYSIITVGSSVFFECMKEQKSEYNLQNLKNFKEVKEILKTPLIDIYVFLFFIDDLEKLDLKELKKIKYPKIFFSKKSDNFKTIKKDNVLSSFLVLPINYQDLEKIIKLVILKFKFLFQSKLEIGKYQIDKNERKNYMEMIGYYFIFIRKKRRSLKARNYERYLGSWRRNRFSYI